MSSPAPRHTKLPPEVDRVLRAVRGTLWAIGAFSLVYNLLVLAVPVYTLQLFDRVLSSRSIDTLILLTVITIGLLLFQGLLDWVRGLAMRRVSVRLDLELTPPVMRSAVLYAAQGHPEANQPLHDLTEVRTQIGAPTIFALFDAPWAPVFLAILFLMHPLLGAFATVGTVLLVALALLNLKLAKRPQSAEGQRIIADSRQVNDYVRNAEAIQAMGMLGSVQRRWFGQNAETLWLRNQVVGRLGALTAFTKFARLAMQIGIMGLGVTLVLANELSPGAMIAASIIMARAVAPFEQAVGAWKGWMSALAAWRRLLDSLNEPRPERTAVELPRPAGTLAITGISFAPSGGQPILRGVTFRVAAGECLGLIGPSGAGKTTLARLLVGAMKPTLGEIRLDGANMSDWDREDIGRHVGYLPQDVQLFSGTVRENICRFRDDAEDADVLEAARLADVHEMIMRLPDAYNTSIGEGGFPISAGQRQRVALARAVFGLPAVIVLDEPNSHLDNAGDQALLQTLLDLKERDVTVIAITHRSSLLRAVDSLVLLRDGAVERWGPRGEVLEALGGPPQARQVPSHGAGAALEAKPGASS